MVYSVLLQSVTNKRTLNQQVGGIGILRQSVKKIHKTSE